MTRILVQATFFKALTGSFPVLVASVSTTAQFIIYKLHVSIYKLLSALTQSGLAPLCENMPSGKATKPGDVVTAKNGKTIQVGGAMMTGAPVCTYTGIHVQ